MNKALTEVPGQTIQLAGQVLLGGLCGVGLLWTLTTLWPMSRRWVLRAGDFIETLSSNQPVVIVGLLAGMSAALIWRALRK